MYVISINYRRAPLSVRGQLAFSKEEQIEFLKMCRESQEMGQSVLLSTCNRLELYTQFAEEEINPEAVRQEHFIQMEEALAMAKGVSSALCRKYVSCYHGEKALRHLHRVTSGIDSMVLGEDEILRQVKRAYQLAVEEKCAQYALHTIFHNTHTEAEPRISPMLPYRRDARISSEHPGCPDSCRSWRLHSHRMPGKSLLWHGNTVTGACIFLGRNFPSRNPILEQPWNLLSTSLDNSVLRLIRNR